MRVAPRVLIGGLINSWGRQRTIALLPWVVLTIGLAGTVAVSEQTRRFGEQEHLRIESTLLDNVSDALRSKLEINISMLAGVVGLFNSSVEVNRENFATYYQTVALNTGQLKGVQGVGFARLIPAPLLEAYEQRIRSEGFANFSVRPPGPRALYSSIEFLEPFDWRNQRAFGFDMYSEPIRRQAMQAAWQTGAASLSGKVKLVQETQEDMQRGVLIYLPVYADRGLLPGASTRKLLGWAYSPLRMNDLVNSSIASIDNTDMAGTGVLVFDGDRPFASQLLYDNLKLVPRQQLSHPSYEPLHIGGRTWLVGVQLSPRLVGPNGITSAYWINLLLGGSTSIVAALVTHILVANHLATREALVISEAASQERALASTVFEESSQGIVVTNPDGQILMANNSFSQLTGFRLSEIKGQRTNLLKSGRHDAAFYEQMRKDLNQKSYWEGDLWNKLRNGEIRCHHLSITTVRDEKLQPRYFVGMYQDVTERHQAEQSMRYMAMHDTLTGLANRSMLMEQLERHLALAKRHGHALGLLYLDLDGFKLVNDKFGHKVGDQVLEIVAERFSKVIRDGDLLCRQGGDEFVVLVPEAGNCAELEAMARKLVDSSRLPYLELNRAINISASVGIARYPDHGESREQLLSAADNAMYAAKRSSGKSVQVSGLLQALDDHSHQHQGTGQSDQQSDSHG